MRTFDVAPLYRSTVGFDHLFELMEHSIRPDWPPYNIEKTGADDYAITMAVAGFAPEEIEVTQTGAQLLVSGRKEGDQDSSQYLHQGIAFRSFKQTFNLADHMRVAGANLQNGLLTIALRREVPEALKPRRVEIGAAPQADAPKQITGEAESRQAA